MSRGASAAARCGWPTSLLRETRCRAASPRLPMRPMTASSSATICATGWPRSGRVRRIVFSARACTHPIHPRRARAVAWRGVCDPRLVDASLSAALVVLIALAQPYLSASDTLVSVDTASQYYPWYAFLGENLRAGRIPGWNPATFSGAPFAADPLSGWTYLPAMMLFAVLPLAQAAKALLVFHPLLAAWSTYALARALGFSRVGAFVAGLAYANTGFIQIQNVCCSPV